MPTKRITLAVHDFLRPPVFPGAPAEAYRQATFLDAEDSSDPVGTTDTIFSFDPETAPRVGADDPAVNSYGGITLRGARRFAIITRTIDENTNFLWLNEHTVNDFTVNEETGNTSYGETVNAIIAAFT